MTTISTSLPTTPATIRIILPPSEGKAAGGQGRWNPADGAAGTLLAEARRTVLDQLSDPSTRPRGAVWNTGATLPAWRRYRGVVWKHLDPDTLGMAARQRAQTQVFVASALGGLFGWDDPVPDYKLKMSARTTPTGKLATFWRQHLAQHATELFNGVVYDLCALEQSEALPRRGDWVRVELVGPDGKRSGHDGKAAKGRLARAMLEVGPDVLTTWEDPQGWKIRLG